MLKKVLLYAGFSSILLLGACGGSGESDSEEESSTDDMASKGEELYQENNCMGCHGRELEGGTGPNLQDVGDRLSPDEIEAVIAEGPGQMPAGLITDDEDLDAIVEWLSSQTAE
jgi:cytochrome c551